MKPIDLTKIIPIRDGCDPDVMDAITQFQDRWRPYTASSRRYPIVGLIEKLIDPAVAAYTATLPNRYLNYIPGAGTGVGISGIIRLVGLDAMLSLQREFLRRFIRFDAKQSARDQRFVATHESLEALVFGCAHKQPTRSALRDSKGSTRELNCRRPQHFCRFCGSLTELASYAGDEFKWRGKNENGKLRLSSLYCKDHRPKLPGDARDTWNPAYQQAKQTQAQFDLELGRIIRQCARRSTRRAESGDQLVDSYFFHYFLLKQTLEPADKAELRNLARLMVDSKLSDTKKKILILQYSGLSQSEIAQKLGIKNRQSVSKALLTIPTRFKLQKEDAIT